MKARIHEFILTNVLGFIFFLINLFVVLCLTLYIFYVHTFYIKKDMKHPYINRGALSGFWGFRMFPKVLFKFDVGLTYFEVEMKCPQVD